MCDRGREFGGTYKDINTLLFEKLVTSKLEGSLEEVSGSGWPESGKEGSSTFGSNDLAETTNHALIVNGWLELDTSLDAAETC